MDDGDGRIMPIKSIKRYWGDESTTKRLTVDGRIYDQEADLADHHDVLPELQHLRVALHHLIELVYWQTFKWQREELKMRVKSNLEQKMVSKSNLGQCQSHS